MANLTTFSEWVKQFKTGHTLSIYLLFYQVAMFFVLAVVLREYLIPLVFAMAAMMGSAMVLADLVAHLFYNGTTNDMTFKEYALKITGGRTHDIYGQIAVIVLGAFMVIMSPHSVFLTPDGVTNLSIVGGFVIISTIVSIIQMVNAKFYH